MSLLINSSSGVGTMIAWFHHGTQLAGKQLEANFVMIDLPEQSKADG